MSEMAVIINGNHYTATLETNETAQAFVKQLPLTLTMNELNGNEKYYYLESSLPTEMINLEVIHAGDIMLYGDCCIVIFYQTFKTSYRYTKIGHIAAMPVLDSDTVVIQFQLD